MKTHFIKIVLIGCVLLGCVSNDSNQLVIDERKVIAYVNHWEDNWGTNFEKAQQLTHINYAFANIKDGLVIEGNKNDTETLKKLNQLKGVNKNLKILISIGGWTWSKHFSDAALTAISREKFSDSAIDFMLKHKLDGIDLDWEYPGQIGDNNIFRAEDKENFTKLLKMLRKKLDALLLENDTYLLTIATGANQNYLDHTNMKEAHEYLDFINIMTYDFYTGGSDKAGHHSNLKVSKFDLSTVKRSSMNAVNEHLNAGIPAHKIVLGLPFYGRFWKGVTPLNNGLYQNGQGKRGTYNYKNIKDSLNGNIFVSKWDSTAMAPYIWRLKDSLFISYEDERSIEHKVNFIKISNLGGVMFWQFNGDNGDLLNAISKNLESK